MSFSHAIPFSTDQLRTLASWSEARPCGLQVRIVTDHAELEEIAEVVRFGQSHPAYWITAISTGEVDVIGSEAIGDVAADLDVALAWIECQEAAQPAVSA